MLFSAPSADVLSVLCVEKLALQLGTRSSPIKKALAEARALS
jgi:hypothetical protein